MVKPLYFQDYRKEKDIDFKTSIQKAVGIFALIVHLRMPFQIINSTRQS